MDDLKRQEKIGMISSLIQTKRVTRRNFFGSVGKIAVLSQVVALGAANFLASCVAFEDKKDYGMLKEVCTDPNLFVCPDPSNYGCSGDFSCEPAFTCAAPDGFFCQYIDVFACGPEIGSTFACNPTSVFHYTHSGGCPCNP